MKDFIQIYNKIPPINQQSREGDTEIRDGENYEIVNNPILCITMYSIYEYKISDDKVDCRIIDWLNRQNFTLKE